MESASVRLVDFSTRLFGDPEIMDIRNMSPLIPYSLFQTALIQYRCWKRNNEVFGKERLDSLMRILGYFSKRWLSAGKWAMPCPASSENYVSVNLASEKYLVALENLLGRKATLAPRGFCINTTSFTA